MASRNVVWIDPTPDDEFDVYFAHVRVNAALRLAFERLGELT
jgi:hypothetical protein